MLHRDNIFIYLLLSVILISCKNENKYDTTLYVAQSKNRINTNYDFIHRKIKDTLSNWRRNNLLGTSLSCNYSNYKLDMLVCFNKQVEKIVTCILESECKEDVSDGIKILYGAKIKNQWYFFSGAYIVLPREYYQDDIHTPLSFEKLHEIAMKEVFSGYLIKKKKDLGFWKNTFSPEYDYEINERFFESMENKNATGGGYGDCFSCKTFEEYVLHLVKQNWERKKEHDSVVP